MFHNGTENTSYRSSVTRDIRSGEIYGLISAPAVVDTYARNLGDLPCAAE
jgi:hypothetical protein